MGTLRIEARFAALKAQNKCALISYIMVGDPDLETSFDILKGLPKAGADIIELGFPFSDPMAEGPSIQLAAERSLKAGTKIADVFELVSRFREIDQTTPIILMGYMNPIESMGHDVFAKRCFDAGADGAIIVDCPPEEAGDLSLALDAHDIALIRLVTPTSDEVRLKTLVKGTKGFIYYVSVAGVTGVKAVDPEAIRYAVGRVRELANLPVCVGFGIRTPEQAQNVAKIADGCVIGSVLVDEIKNSLLKPEAITQKLLEKLSDLAQSVHQAR